ncbi:serine/threonine-protein kinase [Jidongwangia harbinensis]|uniref:serine/threonine-protein kinase n=1 Tax=Jidongwangia harbinensis TaxID=2878561 RepID=UPI001CD9EB91|nr:serine/threonine-protein kinase [Jidongwangia harbinensis]MCA2217346.1 serine/threonine protein kinase [Jidongwangia harbinensis]
MQSALHARDPRWLGRYELIARLGQGGMGVVFLGRDPSGRSVAVKIVRSELAYDEQYRNRFRSEVSRVRQVPPFCTAEVLDADPDHDPPYLVVEYVDGPSLAAVVRRRGRLQGAELHGVAVGIATALAAIHGAGVIHRDLKPDNVLFAMGGVKVIDFGIARPLEATSHHTRTDHMVGTVAYMAPERFDTDSDSGAHVTTAADVFAWGAVVAYAATGRTPFAAESPPATAVRILTQPPNLDGVPAPLRDLVGRALQKDPRHRPSARELLDLLLPDGRPAGAVPPAARIALTDETPVTVARQHPDAARRRRRRWAWPTVAGAALATAALTAAIGLPQILDRDDPGRGADRAGGAPSAAPSAPAKPPAAADPGPAEPFTFTFSGYRVGRLRVHDPVIVSSAYEIARVTGDGDLFAYLTVYRPGAFDPEAVAGGERTTVAGRPALQRTVVRDGSSPNGTQTDRFLAWQYADQRWATVQSHYALENNPAPRDLRALAERLKPDRAAPAKVPLRMTYVPPGYRPVQVGSRAWASLNGIASADDDNYGGVVFAKSPPEPSGLTAPWETDTDDHLPNRFEILVSPATKRARPTAPRCGDDFCYTWGAGGAAKIDVVSGQLPDAEMKKILEGLEVPSVTDASRWPDASSAFPVQP